MRALRIGIFVCFSSLGFYWNGCSSGAGAPFNSAIVSHVGRWKETGDGQNGRGGARKREEARENSNERNTVDPLALFNGLKVQVGSRTVSAWFENNKHLKWRAVQHIGCVCVRRYTQQGHGGIQSAEHVTSALVSSRLKVSGWKQTPKKISKTPPSFLTLWSGEGDKKRIWTENVGTCGGRGREGGDGRNYFKPKESDTTLSVNPPKSVAERWKQRKIWVSGDVFQRCLEHRGWTPIISWTNKCTPLLLFPLRALLEVSGGKENCINKFWKQVQSSRCVGVKCGGIPDFWKLFFRLFCWTNAFNR